MPQKEIFAAIAIQIITCTSAIGLELGSGSGSGIIGGEAVTCLNCLNDLTGQCSRFSPMCCAPCLGTYVMCPFECPNSESFTQVSGTNYEAICVTTQNGTATDCQYQCISNYFNYPSDGVINIGEKPVCYKCPTTNVLSCTSTGLTCKTGYYHKTSDHTCAPCPSNATCTADNFNCAKGYYKASSTSTECTRCPYDSATKQYGTTSVTGSTAATQCYIPSEITLSDSTGEWEYTSNCNYTN